MPKHPLSIDEVELFNFDEGISKIDWDAMEKSSTISNYVKNVRMAECLTEKLVPLECFHSIAVRNNSIKQIVIEKISHVYVNKPFVNVQPWLGV